MPFSEDQVEDARRVEADLRRERLEVEAEREVADRVQTSDGSSANRAEGPRRRPGGSRPPSLVGTTVLEGLPGMARRRPGLLLLAATTGFVVGRVLRNARAHGDGDAHQEDDAAGGELDLAALDALAARLWSGDVDDERSPPGAAERAGPAQQGLVAGRSRRALR